MSNPGRSNSEGGTARRGVLIVLAIAALAAIPFAFGDALRGCRVEPGRSLVVALHPSLQPLRADAATYFDLPSVFDRTEVRPAAYENPDDLRGYACGQGYAWALWIGPAEGGGLESVLVENAPRPRRVLEGRTEIGAESEAGRIDGMERLGAEGLIAVLRAAPGWEGLEFLEGASPEVVRNYLHGEALFRGSNFRQAIEVFGYVTEDAPDLAWGWFRLANAHAWDRGQYSAWGAIGRALELADDLPPADHALVAAVREHYRMQYGFLEAFDSTDPGSAEALLQRGDALFHLAPMHALDPREAVPWLEAAVRMDPGLTPARLHLIDAAILAGDSAAAHRHYAAYTERSRGSIPWLRAKYALELVFGDDRTRGRALAAIDSARAHLPFSVPYLAQEYLSGLETLPFQERLLLLDERVETDDPYPDDRFVRGARRLLVYTYLYQGRLEEAARMIQRLGPEDRVFRKVIAHSARMWGLPWKGRYDPAEIDPEDPVDLFYSAALRLADRRFDAYDALADELVALGEVDPDVVRWKRALDARRRWLETGDAAEFDSLRAVATDPDVLEYFATHETMRWWMAEMAARAGRWDEAAKWYGSIPGNPYAVCRTAVSRRAAQRGEDLDPEAACATVRVAPSGRPVNGRPTRTSDAQ